MSIKCWKKRRNKLFALFSTCAVLFVISAMLIWPQETYQGALYGLELWGTILVPSLLPFFIIAEIMLNLGIVNMLGVLLEPLMRPLFYLPGSASFVLAMGFTSGFPMGAVLTKRLHEEKACTRSEAERLIAFTNNASPLFLMVAVAVGMFQQASLGLLLLLSHYLANIILGIFLGIKARLKEQHRGKKQKRNQYPGSSLLLQSIHALLKAQQKRKPWGQLLSDAIKSGINTICLIGGFVIIYAVLIKVLQVTSLLTFCQYPCSVFLQICGLDSSLDLSLATGFWEMTLGLKKISSTTASFPEKAIIASILLGWSGLSIQSQVTGVLSGSGINPRLYYQGRIIQGLLSGLLTYLLILNGNWLTPLSTPTLTPQPSPSPFLPLFTFNFLYLSKFFYLAMFILFFISGLTLCLNYFLKK
ncbi:MAG: sporulation integral membrane protein YlbJ [Peptococcia bacterium]|jgi:sporulation integral membrane protein YlbJ